MLLQDAATWDAQPTTPARARALVGRVAQRGGHPELVATATLLTSELVTNAVEHAGGPVSVHVRCDDEALRVEVRDVSRQEPRCLEVVEDAVGGRGVLLVESLARGWGTRALRDGKIVWFELTVH